MESPIGGVPGPNAFWSVYNAGRDKSGIDNESQKTPEVAAKDENVPPQQTEEIKNIATDGGVDITV